MIEIKSLKDIRELKNSNMFSKALLETIEDELMALKDSFDIDNEFTMDEFQTDYFGYGYIALLEGNESKEDFIRLGVNPNFENNTLEDVTEYIFDNDKWSRVVIIYNDSYSMSFWLKSAYLKTMNLSY